MQNNLTNRRKIGYASGIISESVLYNMFYTYFLFFLTDIAGINPAIAGTISMISIIVDGITDPIIGHFADKKHIDKRRIMKMAVIPMSILFVFAFTRFNLSPSVSIIYFIAVAVMFWVAYTCYTIPYYALCAEMTTDYDERTKIRGISSFINAAPIFIGSAAIVFVGLFSEDKFALSTRWTFTAIIIAMVSIIFGYVAYLSTKKLKLYQAESEENVNIFETYLQVIKIKPFKYLLAFILLFMLQSSLAQADLIFLLQYRMQVDPDAYMPIALGAIVLGMVIFVPITTKMATMKDRRITVIILLSIATLGMLAFKFIGITNVYSLITMLLFYSMGLAVFWTTFYSFTYDIAEIDEMVNGKKRVGAITSLPQLLQKFGAAIGMQTIGLVLSFTGYNKDLAVQSHSAVMGIESIITIFCPIVMGLAVLFMVLYPVTKARYQKLQEALEKKKANVEYDLDDLDRLI
ncbi:MAG: MFS transporter [Eubacteriales bacterium]